MSTHTHCDRCGESGPHKGEYSRTWRFPGTAAIEIHDDAIEITRYELCAECTVELAEFLGETAVADGVHEARKGGESDE